MKIIDQSFVEYSETRLFQKVELCGRVCYKSEDKITDDSGLNFVKKICVMNHGSVLEHYNFIFKLSKAYYDELKNSELPFFVFSNITCPIVSFNLRAFVTQYNADKSNPILLPITSYLAQKYPSLFECDVICDESIEEIRDIEKYCEEERDLHQRITIKLITDRGVSHELVRHRLASFSQESTRYCNYGKDKFGNEITVIKPIGLNDETYPYWEKAMQESEKNYFEMINHGATAQLARSVLPNSLKTELCITASLAEWKLIFELRCAAGAHPDCRHIMCQVKDYFVEKGYIK